MKPWVTTKINNHCDQVIEINPSHEFDSLELCFSEADGTCRTNPLYINKEELPIIIKILQDMMDYSINK